MRAVAVNFIRQASPFLGQLCNNSWKNLVISRADGVTAPTLGFSVSETYLSLYPYRTSSSFIPTKATKIKRQSQAANK